MATIRRVGRDNPETGPSPKEGHFHAQTTRYNRGRRDSWLLGGAEVPCFSPPPWQYGDAAEMAAGEEDTMTQAEMAADWDRIAATSTEYYAAYYRRRRDEALQEQVWFEQQGNADSALFYAMRANDYEEAAKAQER